jgi:light-regulated signal transduction histidine kinase (bacteriophytochrome)
VGTNATLLVSSSSEDALSQAIANLGSAISESNSIITREPLPAVMADEGQLIQVFQNLIGNAIKYHGADTPRVHISCSHDAVGMLRFSVKDNGIGIESQYLKDLWHVSTPAPTARFRRNRHRFGNLQKDCRATGGAMTVCSSLGAGSIFSSHLRRDSKAYENDRVR